MADLFCDMKLIALARQTGYNIVQENGQRKFGPPPGWIGPPPPKGSEIFVGKLPRDVYENELVPLCEQFGKIYELRLMMDFNGENRGYAFVTYTNPEDAAKAIKGLDDYEIRANRHIGVCKSVDNCRLFIGGIPKDKSKGEIEGEISKFTDGVSKIILYSSVTDKTKNRGFAFVEYESHRAAAMARRRLISNNVKLFEHEIAVDWAQPEAQVEDETMKRVKVLYVRNLSSVTSEDQLHLLFSMAGVLRVERVKKMRDFAFIHYSSREDAEKALQKFDGVTLDGCLLEVTWAKPPENQKQKILAQKRESLASLCRNLNYDGHDSGFEAAGGFLHSPSVNGYPILSRNSLRSRFPVQGIQGLKNPMTITKPIQLLNYICLENGWGEPEYQVSYVESDPDLFFVCMVHIPGFPPPHQRIMSDKLCRSPEEARYAAACYVLRKLNITDVDAQGPFSSPPSSLSSVSNCTFAKNFGSFNGSFTPGKSGLSSPFNLCSTPKSGAKSATFQSPYPVAGAFGGAGADSGIVVPSNSPPSPPNLDLCGLDDSENSLQSLLDPNTPIEPTSLLGLIASMAAATNTELPIFNNKPKL